MAACIGAGKRGDAGRRDRLTSHKTGQRALRVTQHMGGAVIGFVGRTGARDGQQGFVDGRRGRAIGQGVVGCTAAAQRIGHIHGAPYACVLTVKACAGDAGDHIACVCAHHVAQCAHRHRAGGVAVISFVHAGGGECQCALGDGGRAAAGARHAVVGGVTGGQGHARYAHRLADIRIAIGKSGGAVQGEQVARETVVAGGHRGRGVGHAVIDAVHPGVIHAQGALRHRQRARGGGADGIAQAAGYRGGRDDMRAHHVIARGRHTAPHRA